MTFSFLNAQAEKSKFESCSEQIKQLCANEKSPGQIMTCLRKNEAVFSLQCKEEIKRVARGLEQANEQGGRSLSILGGLSSQAPPFPIISYEGILTQGTPKIADQRLNASTPIYQTATDYLALSLAVAQVHLSDSFALSSILQTPKDLYRAEIGTQYTRRAPDHSSWGLRGSIGYATDHFSGKANDTIFNLTLQYGSPTAAGNYLTWFVFISNNSPLGNYIPVPGLMYVMKSDTFTAALGFPIVSLQWTPQKDWAYSVSALGPAITTEAAYGQIKEIQSFASLNWNNQSFILQDRQENKDRLTIEDKKIALGLRSFIFDRMQIEARFGYAFDRQIYSGTGFRNMSRGSVQFDSDYFMSISLKSGF